jgi:DNA polymerase-3 subunit epsilon
MILLFKRTLYRIKLRLFKCHPKFQLLNICWHSQTYEKNRHWKETDYLVVDLEMTSLDVKTGEILSIGWVVINKGMILLNSAEHHIIHSNQSVGQSAAIHQLRDCEVEQGLNITDISVRFLEMAANKTLVFHHAPLDMAFLDKACNSIYGAPLLLQVIDTLNLEKNKLMKHHDHIKQGELRLAACRDRYNLPLYPTHNALMDALATAELLLAISNHKGIDTTLNDLI